MEILDSRGRPTVRATCVLEGGARGTASVPSGASTGRAEAHELRDGDPRRYGGLGCLAAAANVSGPISFAASGRTFATQREFDEMLLVLDGTPDRSRLGANALLAASLAFARASALAFEVLLYEAFAELIGRQPARLPRLTVNLFSGGKHAGGQVPIQDVMVVPAAGRTTSEQLAMVFDVYQSAADLALRSYGYRPLVADEGGLAPNFPSVERMLEDAVAAVAAAGYEPGRDVALGVDLASSHFFAEGRYRLGPGLSLTGPELVDVIGGWTERFPIVSVEDGLAEDDWEIWPALRSRLANRAVVVGDDLLVTNAARIQRAVDLNAANALLLKVNQVGTLTEAAEALRIARSAGWMVTISARSGETEDDWLADLAVGWGGDQIKVGSITRSERLAKYNRLLAIESETSLPVITWPADRSWSL